jgi:hypothetical protein
LREELAIDRGDHVHAVRLDEPFTMDVPKRGGRNTFAKPADRPIGAALGETKLWSEERIEMARMPTMTMNTLPAR